MPTYTVAGLTNPTTRAVLISAVFKGSLKEVSTRHKCGEWGQWTRFTDVVEAENPARAEAMVSARFTMPLSVAEQPV
ncbi:hypothetical protein E1288_21050 [Saccharopolyspora elongata]|uniref:Uncharacterized protein n=2 Tax=Saccharopolyspora elongata TaxID=2530387 RepID=A0A4R4YX79_9PSEU|nr:hypothetical protein E1288_21050 [Saccharopolyspora elongata]